MVMFATFFFPLGNHLVDRFGWESRPVIAIGGSLALSIEFFCVSMELTPGWFILLYSFGMGIFKGFLQSSLLRAGWSHLPERKGLVTGCIISGYGFGGFIFGILAQKIANPDNISTVEDPSDGLNYLPIDVGNRTVYMLNVLSWTWLACSNRYSFRIQD